MPREPKAQIINVPADQAYGTLVFGGDGDSAAQVTSFTVPSGSRPGRMYGIEVSWVSLAACCPCEGVSWNYDTCPDYEHDPECHAPTHKALENWETWATDLEREHLRVKGWRLPPSIMRKGGLCVHLKKVQRCLKRRFPEPGGPTYFELFRAVEKALLERMQSKPDYVKPERQAS